MKVSIKKDVVIPLIWVIIGSFIFSPLASAIYDPEKKQIFLITAVLKFLSLLWKDILNYKLSLWITLLFLIVCSYIIKFIINYKPENPLSKLPKYLSYKTDKFKKLRWHWEWDYIKNDYHPNGYWEIIRLKPECEKCTTIMDNKGNPIAFTCPGCSHRNENEELITDIYALIRGKIQKNNYPKKYFLW